jgi:hypothetical protein
LELLLLCSLAHLEVAELHLHQKRAMNLNAALSACKDEAFFWGARLKPDDGAWCSPTQCHRRYLK